MRRSLLRKLGALTVSATFTSLLVAAGCCPSSPQRAYAANRTAERANESGASGGEAPLREHHGEVLRGDASYYASFFKGRKTSNGERYDPKKMTAANRTLPFGTRLRVTRVDTGKSVVVRVNDRGPFGKRRRILDLSRAAAEQLDLIGPGHAEVEAVVLD